MDAKIVVSVRGMLVTGVLLLALLAAYLVGAAGRPGLPASGSEEEAGTPTAATAVRRTLTLTGSGEASAVPDRMTFRLSVSRTRDQLDLALADASRTMRRVLGALKEHGVAREDVQTTGLSMTPVYSYPEDSDPVLIGYRVTQRVRVAVPELRNGGRAVTAAVEAGGNGVRARGIRLEVGDPEAVLARARDAAVAAATRKAEEYAAATGQDLGPVLTLREVTPRAPSDRVSAGYGLDLFEARRSADLPVRAGEDELSVTVSVVWEFA